MSDYLSNLITRSHAGQPAIRPRLLSRFESTAVELFHEAQSSKSSHPSAQTPSPASPAGLEAIANEQSGTGKLAADAEISLSAEKVSSQTPRLAPPFPPTTIPAARPNENHAIDFVSKESVIPGNPAFAGKNPDSAAEPPLFPAASARPAFQARRSNHFSPGEPRPSAPAIHVTIGRVEVRAIHSASPAPKPVKAAAPKLSLDDYLQKRDGGAR